MATQVTAFGPTNVPQLTQNIRYLDVNQNVAHNIGTLIVVR
jgi:hypothetical protein